MNVEVRKDDVEGALRLLKKKLKNERFFEELKDRTYYTSPSEKAKKEKAIAIKRWRKKEAASKLKRA